MHATALRVYVRNPGLERIGQVDDYVSLNAIPRFNAIGAFSMEIAADSEKAPLLVEGNGLIIRTATGDLVDSGPIRTVDWARSESDAGSGKLTVSGISDTEVLAQYTCWPNPAAAIGSQSDAVYKVTDTTASTAMRTLVNLNAGPGALTARKNALLTLAADTFVGAPVTREVNQFDGLLVALQDIARAAGVGFRVVQVGAALQFQVFEPVDRSGTARFSFGLGNLTDANYSTTPPTCTRAIVVAGGQSSPRECRMYDRADPLFPGLFIEQFIDQTGTDTASVDLEAQMDQAAEEALTSGAGQGSLSISPIDLPQLRYGRDYSVGDTVSAQVRGVWYTDVVREVALSCTAAEGTSVKATVGTGDSDASAVARIYSYLAKIKTDVARLKTRKAA
ncbi:siphovirus ReqiPepy6 Gp37-like family protein [Streptomyces sp. NBC_01716]|uniref:siphovirus ReqiPepy6 Gp37-like family protein n=1 Tax=Streptomyces sp. NBC_01716 TaxID=2975917 RepID=UPI002E34BE2A|nr:siphovirus ReqiPepy6 Gp37-like family protein [Streptomyces sp. NBC_01716]